MVNPGPHQYQSLEAVQVIKLSDAVQSLHRQTTQFVHGVPQSFLDVGVKKAGPPVEGQARFSRGAYFIGKVQIPERAEL